MYRPFKPSKKYLRAWNDLYADRASTADSTGQLTLPIPKAHKNRAITHERGRTEEAEQIIAATWLTKNGILFYHTPNGGKRTLSEGVKFKRLGVKAGIPDICIPLPRKPYHGLYIELKRESGGKLSEAQKYWLAELKNQGYDVFVANGAKELINHVKIYLGVSE